MAKERSMALSEELKQFSGNAEKEIRQLYEKIKQRPLTSFVCIIVIITAVTLLVVLPYWRVTQFGIADPKDLAEMENNYRATLAQILGGIAVGIGIYFAWGNLTTARESQITERFTRAIDQLGNDKLEIRLGGIYALEKIASESEKDHWPIMEILTTYVRENSPIVNENIEIEDRSDLRKVSSDIQAILTVIGRREYSLESKGTNRIDLRETNLRHTNFLKANFSNSILIGSDLSGANLSEANFSRAFLSGADFSGAKALQADFKEANLSLTNLSWVKFINADLSKVFWPGANLSGADFYGANLQGAKQLTIDQLSQAKTLYKAELDEELKKLLSAKCPVLFEEPKCGCYHISAQKK